MEISMKMLQKARLWKAKYIAHHSRIPDIRYQEYPEMEILKVE